MQLRMFGYRGGRGDAAGTFAVLVAILVAALVLPGESHAQGTQQEQDACRPEVFRLCSAYIPDVDGIVSCLRSNRPNLNAECQQVMFPAPEPARPTHRRPRHRIRQG